MLIPCYFGVVYKVQLAARGEFYSEIIWPERREEVLHPAQSGVSGSLRGQFRVRAKVERERKKLADTLDDLNNLLEEYAPAWYTDEHRRRVTAALKLAKKSGG